LQGALQQWLGDLIEVETVRVEREDATLLITLSYFIRRNQERQIAEFRRSVS
jgi:uncharacterized protein